MNVFMRRADHEGIMGGIDMGRLCLLAALSVAATATVCVGPAHAEVETDATTPPIFQTLRDYHPGEAVVPDYSRAGENRLLNAGFEKIRADGKPSGWRTVGAVRVTTDQVRSGAKAVRLDNPNWPRSDGRLVQTITKVQGGGAYRAAVYMRSLAGSHNVNIKFEAYTSTGKSLGGFRSEHFTVSKGQGWVRVEYTHKLPPLPNLTVAVLYRLWGRGPLLLDDASFCLVQQAPLYLSPKEGGACLKRTSELLVWTAPLPTRIRAEHPVTPERARRWPEGALRLRLAGNETGILPLFLTAFGSDLNEVDVQAATGEAGDCELALYTVEPFCYLGELYYDVLVPMQSFKLAAGASKMVWLSVYMPGANKRRALHGKLRVTAKGVKPVVVPFSVDTFAFDLPREPALPFSVGIPRPGRPIRPEERRQWLRDIARHRMSIRFLANPALWFEGDTPIFDFTRFDAELAEATNLGMRLFQLPFAYIATGHGAHYSQFFGPLGPHQISDEFRRKFVNAMRVLAAHLEEKGVLDRFNHNLFDEPYPEHYAQVKELAKLLKQADPRYRPSIYGGGDAAVDGELVDFIEEPVGAGWNARARARLRQRGALVSVYNPLQTCDVTRRPELARGFAWWAFRCRLDRVYHWCISPSPRTMHAHDYGSAWVFENPGHDAFLSTVRFEMLREGLEDYDYLTLFRRALEAVAEKLGVNEVDSHGIVDFFAAQLSDVQIMKQCIVPRKYERIRNFVGRAIEELPKRPLVLFRLSRGEKPDRVRVDLWTEPGARATLRVGKSAAMPASGSTELALGAAEEIELCVSKGGHVKRLILPVLTPQESVASPQTSHPQRAGAGQPPE